MLKEFLIGITICFLSIALLGCQPEIKADKEKPKPITPVITENDANSEANNKQDIEAGKITAAQAEKTAFEAVKKAKNTVPDLKGVEMRYRSTEFRRTIPTNVFSLDDYSKRLEPKVNDVYLALFEDSNNSSNLLYIYIDAITGNIIGCYFKYPKERITETQAEKIAFEAAKKAKNTASYWSSVELKNIKHLGTDFRSVNDNFYVHSLDDYEKSLSPYVDQGVYLVLFQDMDHVSSFLYIYVDAIKGEAIGCKYTSD